MQGALITSGVRAATVNVNPPSLATTVEGNSDVTVTGIRTGDVIVAVTPNAPTDARYFARRIAVQADDTVRITWANESTGTVDPAAFDMTFVWIPLASAGAVGYPMGYQR
jgi:hypothetical protein